MIKEGDYVRILGKTTGKNLSETKYKIGDVIYIDYNSVYDSSVSPNNGFDCFNQSDLQKLSKEEILEILNKKESKEKEELKEEVFYEAGDEFEIEGYNSTRKVILSVVNNKATLVVTEGEHKGKFWNGRLHNIKNTSKITQSELDNLASCCLGYTIRKID